MNRIWVFALVLLYVAVVAPGASARGRSLKASATAVATSTGGSATAVANSDSVGNGVADANAVADASNGGTAVSVVNAHADENEVVKASLTSKADGSVVKGRLDAEAEEGAVAIVKLLLEASGDKVVTVQVWAKGLRTYNGNVIALSLKKAYDESPETGAYATKALAIALRDLIDEHPDEPAYVAETIVQAVRHKDIAAVYFGRVLVHLLEVQGCEYIRPICHEAELLATSYVKDRAFIKSIAASPALIQCVYDTTCPEDLTRQCCSAESQAFGKCQCVGDDCNYKLFWEEPHLIWKCVSDACAEKKSKCTCPAE